MACACKFTVDVQLVIGDLPARAKINRLNGPTGYFACTRCLFRGVRCEEHKRTLYSWNEFARDVPSARTKEQIEYCVSNINNNSKTERPFGVISSSPLSKIISIPEQSLPDYFHICSKIHMPMLITSGKVPRKCHLFYPKSCGQVSPPVRSYGGTLALMLIGNWISRLQESVITDIDTFLSSIQYPHSYNRRPMAIMTFQQWKASEMRTFLFYIALPVLVRFCSSLSNDL
ncbi:unnamed protein product, partial [Rotaria magnacalcarata]